MAPVWRPTGHILKAGGVREIDRLPRLWIQGYHLRLACHHGLESQLGTIGGPHRIALEARRLGDLDQIGAIFIHHIYVVDAGTVRSKRDSGERPGSRSSHDGRRW